jgi:hypothetical protein
MFWRVTQRARARRSAVARPIPLEAPVTTATFPSNLPINCCAPRNVYLLDFTRLRSFVENRPQRSEPLRHRLLETLRAIGLFLRRAFESYRPLEECAIPVHDRNHARRSLVIGYCAERSAGLINIRTFQIRMRQQPLPNTRTVFLETANGADGVARFTVCSNTVL